ncbi:MAG: hypothetical protein GC160_18365 [Acidobacteria bacterium]|nr:hypothetical protein [Acidobacteriota bacterium]
MPNGGRTGKVRAGTALLLVLLAVVVGVWWSHLRPQPTLELLLGALPGEPAIVAYVDVPSLRRAPHLGPWIARKLAEQDDALPLAAGVRGLSIALGQDSVYLVGALDLTDAGAVSYLAQRKAGCSQPLDEAACASKASAGGYLSMRLLKDNLLAIAHSPDPTAADRMSASNPDPVDEIAKARAALDSGAVVWAGLDPQALDAVMRNPPAGWVNLSLVARALRPADSAELLLREEGDGIRLTLQAACPDDAAATELGAVLKALNKMAAGLAASAAGKDLGAWRGVVDSLDVTVEGRSVRAHWTTPARLLEQL